MVEKLWKSGGLYFLAGDSNNARENLNLEERDFALLTVFIYESPVSYKWSSFQYWFINVGLRFDVGHFRYLGLNRVTGTHNYED